MRNKYILELSILILLFAFVYASFGVFVEPANIENGLIDIDNLEQDKVYRLGGQWHFIPGVFSTESDLDYGLIKAPGAWHKETYKGELLPRRGIGTYKLEVHTDHVDQELMIKVPHLRTNFAIYINDKRVDYGDDLSHENHIDYRYENIRFTPPSKSFQIYVHVLNKDHARGGFTAPMYLGTSDKINLYHSIELLISGLLIGVMFTMFVYHLSLLVASPKDEMTRFFVIIFFFMFVIVAVTGETTVLLLIPGIPELLAIKALYISMILTPYAFFRYYSVMFNEKPLKFMRVVLFVMVLIGLSLIVFSNLYYVTRFYAYYIVTVLVTYVNVLYLSIKLLRKKSVGSTRLFLLQLFFILSFIIDFFLANGSQAFNLTTLTVLATYFALSEAIFLAKESRERMREIQYVQQKELSFYKRLQKEIKIPMKEVLNEISHLDTSDLMDSNLNLLYYKLGALANKIGIEENVAPVTLKKFSLYHLIESIIQELKIESKFEFYCDDKYAVHVKSDPGMLKLFIVNLIFTFIYAGYENNMKVRVNAFSDKVVLEIECHGAAQEVYNFRREFAHLEKYFGEIGCRTYANQDKFFLEFEKITNDEDVVSLQSLYTKEDKVGVITLSSSNWNVLYRALRNDYQPILFNDSGLDNYFKIDKEIKAIVIDVTTTRTEYERFIEDVRGLYSKLEMPIFAMLDFVDNYNLGKLYDLGVNDIVQWSSDRQILLSKLKDALENKQSTEDLLEARTRLLEAQIRPHFVNNSLNSIASLIQTKPDEAEDLIVSFAQYLRYKLKFYSPDKSISLSEEMDLISLYMDIEKVRYEDRLQFSIHNEVGDVQIQPLMIQPLVENAIKHNLEKSNKALEVHVKIVKDGDHISVSVKDNGFGFNYDGENLGVGLSNLQSRLRYIYGEDLQVKTELGKGTEIKFRFSE
ncbi:hypothetical protein EZV73_11470 [Acidaminobacter sp. JC074]|uniref:histidine kinase n=1 Tax=Acidaminobacter sp. JC074 TaxID=2530199 RepID=UPI001F100C3E|nr:histidine kinase [Acidaminobacter sp. JC074]MCH4888197.1 hypothetical protein [Acidaminobacter sp. JC074]